RRGRFVLGEPPILHRFSRPSTPSLKLFFEVPAVRLATSGRLRAANNTICDFFSKRFLKLLLQMCRKQLTTREFIF
ncbi:hypothetical protein, partial [Rhodanobacter panaciterrae]|uniref:hypothetical protein n=1 Tax=Rhodanobacter panaciterrae TaxID=490572 RepID=UPI001E2BE568